MQNHPRLEAIHDDAMAWINHCLPTSTQAPITVLTPVRETAWSLVALVERGQDRWYFKYLPDYFSHELAVSQYAAAANPIHCAAVVASDTRQRFMLVEDTGPMMRTVIAEQPDSQYWLTLLPQYAQLQIQAMTDPAIDGLQLPNRSLSRLPRLIAPHIDAARAMPVDNEQDAFLDAHAQVVREALTHWSDWVSPLYRYGITDTLNHGDLHDGNIGIRRRSGLASSTGTPILFDWGDACYSHPFMSLRTLILSAENRLGYRLGSEDMNRFISAYLAPWQAFATLPQLWDMVTAALRVAPMVTFLNWAQALQNRDDPRNTPYLYALPALLREFVDAQRDPIP